MRSKLIVRYYSQVDVVDASKDLVTGVLYAVTDQSNEIVVFQANTAVPRQTFIDKAAELETALQEPWFSMPVEIVDDNPQNA